MKRNPIFVALFAFALVFIGGAALAGIGPSPQVVETPYAGNATADAAHDNSPITPLGSSEATPQTKVEDRMRADRPSDADTTPPRFAILSPETRSHVEVPVIEVSGAVETGAKVFNSNHRAAHQNGNRWAMRAELEPGRNTLTFYAVDEAGNKTRRTVFVFFDKPDTTPPRFAITSPRDGSETTYKVITVRGEVEEGANVIYGDERAHVGGTEWKINVELRLGRNELKFTAVDEAGNRNTKVLTITRLEKPDEPTGPRFSITSPESGTRTDDRVIVVKGGVSPGSKVFYGDRQARVDGDDWKIEVQLRPGQNDLWFKAIDENGNKTKASVTVWYVGEDVHHEFTANQKYGSCGEGPPYDVFYGTAQPGTVIELASPYGNGRVEVGERGKWEIKIFFEGAPVGEPFTVTVHASTGESKQFTFVHTGGDSGKDQ
jgi:hypothetical protein